MAEVRLAEERDAPGIRDVLRAVYGPDYAYPEYYDLRFLKKLIFSDNALVFVAEQDGRIAGTASVVQESGAYTDLAGEFGRLAVTPEYQGRGIGSRLMEARLDRVRDRLHVGFMVARTAHARAQAIAVKHGFAPVGFMPRNLQFGDRRESTAYLATYFHPALELRRNHPRIVPEVLSIARPAMQAVGLEPDFIVDEQEPALPYMEGLEYEDLTAEGYAPLLRIERGRLLQRDVFGPMRLQYGFFRLQARNSRYLIARRDGGIVGALGFIHDPVERTARVFEMIHIEAGVMRGLLLELEQRCRGDLGVVYIEIDVNAHTPGVQRTLIELGYVPAAYVPALAFHRVERIDVVKMCRLLEGRGEPEDWELIPAVARLATLVLRESRRRSLVPRVAELVSDSELVGGLSPEQINRLLAICEPVDFETDDEVFAHGTPAREAYLVLEGEVEIALEGGARVGRVGPGETLGEVALLTGTDHSASARAVGPVSAVILRQDDLTELVRRRPDVGVVVFRNLARGLGLKLRRADRALLT